MFYLGLIVGGAAVWFACSWIEAVIAWYKAPTSPPKDY